LYIMAALNVSHCHAVRAPVDYTQLTT